MKIQKVQAVLKVVIRNFLYCPARYRIVTTLLSDVYQLSLLTFNSKNSYVSLKFIDPIRTGFTKDKKRTLNYIICKGNHLAQNQGHPFYQIV